MSEYLRTRLDALREMRELEIDKQQRIEFLKQISSLEFIEWAEDFPVSDLSESIRDNYLISAIPEFSIKIDAPENDLTEWLVKCLAEVKVSDTIYLSLSGYPRTQGEIKRASTGFLGRPLCKVKIQKPNIWLIDLWKNLLTHYLVITDADKTQILHFFELEYSHTAFIRHF